MSTHFLNIAHKKSSNGTFQVICGKWYSSMLYQKQTEFAC